MAASEYTPQLTQVLKDAMERRLTEVHTAMPGIVESFDPLTMTCTVQPAIKRKYQDAVLATSLPLINKVPVCFPRGGGAYISVPLAQGDTGLIVFSERSIDLWQSLGGTIDPLDARKHHLSDAIFIPGLAPLTSPILNGSAEDLVISLERLFPNCSIRLKPDGTILIGSSGSTEAAVLGNVLKTYLGVLESEINLLSTEVVTLNSLLATLTAAITADAVTLTAVAPATVAAAATVTAGTAALIATNAANTVARAVQKAIYIDVPATNILSQKVFTERGP
jgi:hypothetical protein